MKRKSRKNICLIYNFAQHYRTNIFKLMDKELHCDFIFGDSLGDIKKMDYKELSNVREVKNVRLFGHWYYQKGVLSTIRDYKILFLLGDVHCLTTWIIAFLARFYGTKVYFWSHAWYGKESFWESFCKKIYFNLVQGMFLYGNYARDLMIKVGFNKNKLHVIYNSLDYDHQIKLRAKLCSSNILIKHFNNEFFNIIFVGRLTRVKRLDLLIESLDKIRKGGLKVNLTLIGDGEMKLDLIDKVKKLDLTKEVWFYGACYNEVELSSLIFNADLCVSPGNVGLTAVHSMTYGTPVITHDLFALQMPEFEAIERGVTGDFFKYDDVDSLSETIIKWIKLNKKTREEIRKECYHTIDTKFNPYVQIEVMKRYLV